MISMYIVAYSTYFHLTIWSELNNFSACPISLVLLAQLQKWYILILAA